MSIGIQRYLDTALERLDDRVAALVPRLEAGGSGQEHPLREVCLGLARAARREIEPLSQASDAAADAPPSDRLGALRRIADALELWELVAMHGADSAEGESAHMSALVAQIAREIRYPLEPPAVVCHAYGFYRIVPELRLMWMPLAETGLLLRLPDLYHELGHPLLTDGPPAMREARQAALAQVEQDLTDRLGSLAESPDAPVSLRYLITWRRCWPAWITELFCDVFAAGVLGPAFVWSHLDLCVRALGDPYLLPRLSPTCHPPNAARLSVMLAALRQLGFAAPAENIESCWDGLCRVTGAAPCAEYGHCFPRPLLEAVAARAVGAAQAAGCRLAGTGGDTPVGAILNEAWEVLCADGSDFRAWENQAKARLCG